MAMSARVVGLAEVTRADVDLSAVFDRVRGVLALVYLYHKERASRQSGGNKLLVHDRFRENARSTNVFHCESRFRVHESDSVKGFHWKATVRLDSDYQDSPIGVRERGQYLRQLLLNVVVKSGFVFHPDVFAEPLAEFLDIFKGEIRDGLQEKHTILRRSFYHPNPQLPQLALRHRRRCFHHQVLGGGGFGEGNYLAQTIRSRQNHHDAIEAERDPSVRRSPVL